jgi:serine/threonine protein kinase
MHFQGVVHGDVKPLNVIIQPDTHQVVLVDFGLAAIKPTSKTESKGYTPYFGAPEQQKNLPLLPESDLYSLGMTMIHALGGDLQNKEVPSQTPDEVCKFIKRLLATNPISRPSWRNENLIETLQDVRQQSFGRMSSMLKAV